MDFKVAGTKNGVTAIQMDIKVQGITAAIMGEALAQARIARFTILDKMIECISAPRAEMSAYAPRIYRVQIQPKQIGEVIGPGGKTIRGIQDATGAKLDIEDDGSVFISAVNAESAKKAVDMVERMTRVPEVGDIFFGRVKTIIQSGAFVEILPGKDGFVHISELEPHRVNAVEDVVAVGQEVNVVVTGIRPDGKINLSRRALLTGDMPQPGSNSGGDNRGGGGGSRPRDDRRGPDRRDRPAPQRDSQPNQPQSAQSSPPRAPQPAAAQEPRDAQPQRPTQPAVESNESDGSGSLMRRPRDSRTLPGSDGNNN
jgi:polyribonucleotide nucleotidyltransferase